MSNAKEYALTIAFKRLQLNKKKKKKEKYSRVY